MDRDPEDPGLFLDCSGESLRNEQEDQGGGWATLRDSRLYIEIFATRAVMINVMIVFVALWPADELVELKKSKHCSTLGFNRWFQQQLGCSLSLNPDPNTSPIALTLNISSRP